MNHDEITELLGAYALDAVDPSERTAIDSHIATCARCRAEVEEHREVATLLAHTGCDAPEGLWERIAGSLEEAPPQLRLSPVAPRQPERGGEVVELARRRLSTRIALGAVAAAVALVAVLGVQVRRQDQRIDELQLALQDPLVPAFEIAVTDPTSDLIELTSPDGQLVVRGAITADGVGYLSARALPELPPDRTYQLWGGAGDTLVSLGVLGAEPRIVSFNADPYELFAITEEESPGVVSSQNDPIAAGSVA